MTNVTRDLDDIDHMEASYKWLWFARIAAITLLLMHLVLVTLSAYRLYTLGSTDVNLLSLCSALAGVVVATLLTLYKFGRLGHYSIKVLKKANHEYERVEGAPNLKRRYRNFKRARKVIASLHG